jgi:uncharacterized protein (DUF486 family)
MVMTTAWYLHLKFQKFSIPTAIFFSWTIALGEYSLMVPANRIGHETLSAAQLRGIAELWTIVAFLLFNSLVLKEPLKWKHVFGFGLVLIGVWMILMGPFDKPVFHHSTDDHAANRTTVAPNPEAENRPLTEGHDPEVSPL